jgi:hypothetical protein
MLVVLQGRQLVQILAMVAVAVVVRVAGTMALLVVQVL